MELRTRAAHLKHRIVQGVKDVSRDESLESAVEALRMQVGRAEARIVKALPADRIADAEFTVFSQFGEDGIIQFLLAHVPIEHEVFVEFGVQSYAESNTRFLLGNDNWHGLIIDGDDAHVAFTIERGLDWRHQLDIVQQFIDRDNIDGIIGDAGIIGDIGLLSIDIDGNDYWVLERISVVSPRILITEYNSTWGPEAAVTVPYDPEFRRELAHDSNLFWGASLTALTRAAEAKGYALVGGNRAGNNAFFVRRDVLGALPERSVAEVYRPSRFRESQHQGRRSYVSDHRERLRVIGNLIVWDLDRDGLVRVSDRFAL